MDNAELEKRLTVLQASRNAGGDRSCDRLCILRRGLVLTGASIPVDGGMLAD